MRGHDTNDFIAAFGIGAVLGIGAALLLRPERPDPRGRMMKRIRPPAKTLRKGARRTRKAAAERARTVAGGTEDAIEAGRELLAEFRTEVSRILDDAREELGELAHEIAAARREAGANDGARDA